VVIGKTVSKATREEAEGAVFGITCGNDVSDRNWQRGDGKDLQWWRAKGSDTFSPFGPFIVTGIHYGDLGLETRLNGEVVQSQRTSDLIFRYSGSDPLYQSVGHVSAWRCDLLGHAGGDAQNESWRCGGSGD